MRHPQLTRKRRSFTHESFQNVPLASHPFCTRKRPLCTKVKILQSPYPHETTKISEACAPHLPACGGERPQNDMPGVVIATRPLTHPTRIPHTHRLIPTNSLGVGPFLRDLDRASQVNICNPLPSHTLSTHTNTPAFSAISSSFFPESIFPLRVCHQKRSVNARSLVSRS